LVLRSDSTIISIPRLHAITLKGRHMKAPFLPIAPFLVGFAAPALACNPIQPENFSAFFDGFSSDKAFAVSRTIYPSARIRYEYGVEDGKQQITEIRRTVSKKEDMKYPPIGVYTRSMGLEPKPREVSRTQAVIALSAPENSGLLTYHFTLKQGCWFLQEIQQHLL
jgi:hypothetical protein